MRTDHIVVRELLSLGDAASFRRTGDGYLVANPRVGRTGIQVYGGSELGRDDMVRVRVYRPESEVMDKAALGTIAFRPVTNDHPGEPVTAKNWKKFAVGQTGGDIARDGEFVRVPMVVMDEDTIKDIEAGKRELSLGYSSYIEWRSGVTDGGEAYDAVQTTIRVNHLAIVDAARGGRKLVIGDAVTLNEEAVAAARGLITDGDFTRDDVIDSENNLSSPMISVQTLANTKYPFIRDGTVYRAALVHAKELAAERGETTIHDAADELLQLIDKEHTSMAEGTPRLKSHVVDGITVEMTDTAIEVVSKRMKTLEDALAKATADAASATATALTAKQTSDAQVATLTTQVSTKDAEIVTLKKQVEDGKVTPAKLDQLVKDRAEVVAKSRAKIGDKLVVDGKTTAEMQKQVVDAILGDAAKGWTDEQVAVSFATIVADLKPEQYDAADAMARSFSGRPAGGTPKAEATKAYDAYDKRLENAWKGEQPATRQ